jgi:hypothetical protein
LSYTSEQDWLLITIVTAADDCMRYIIKCFYLSACRLRWVIGSDERVRAFPLLLLLASVHPHDHYHLLFYLFAQHLIWSILVMNAREHFLVLLLLLRLQRISV